MFWSAGCSVLRVEGFFCSFDVLYGGPGISKLQFLTKKNIITEAYVGLMLFNETAALFMKNKVWGTSQLNIDILMSGSHREFDVWVMSSCQRSTPGLNL
jgi:hypothetical protein